MADPCIDLQMLPLTAPLGEGGGPVHVRCNGKTYEAGFCWGAMPCRIPVTLLISMFCAVSDNLPTSHDVPRGRATMVVMGCVQL